MVSSIRERISTSCCNNAKKLDTDRLVLEEPTAGEVVNFVPVSLEVQINASGIVCDLRSISKNVIR